MYLHIGGNTSLDGDKIIAVIPRTKAVMHKDTRRAINDALGAGVVRTVSEEPFKCYVITETDGRLEVYGSPVSSATLLKRSCESEF